MSRAASHVESRRGKRIRTPDALDAVITERLRRDRIKQTMQDWGFSQSDINDELDREQTP